MILLLIRHGQSEADLLNVHEGRADFELTQKGHEQAKRLAEYITGNYKLSKIYSSPLKRAKQTALHLYKSVLESKINFEDDLMEFNNGLLAGLPRDIAFRKYPPIKDLPYDKSAYEMESRLAFRKRADKVLHKIISKEFENSNTQEHCVAIVSHGGLIDQMYKVILGLAIDTALSFKSADTGFHEWKVEKSGILISKCNQISHL